MAGDILSDRPFGAERDIYALVEENVRAATLTSQSGFDRGVWVHSSLT